MDLARRIYKNNTAVLGVPNFLNVPNSSLQPSQTLDGIDLSTNAATFSSIYPEPINLATQRQQMYRYGSYMNSSMLQTQSFNYFHPDMRDMPYLEKLGMEYEATLLEDMQRDEEFQKSKMREPTEAENLRTIAQAAQMQLQSQP